MNAPKLPPPPTPALSAAGFLLGLFALALAACGGATQTTAKTAAPTPPPPPTPPTEAMAWMPADSAVLAHVLIGPFKGTPIWDLWSSYQHKRRDLQFWIDSELVDELTIGANNMESKQPSFVAVVRGRFGAGYLDGLAARDQLAPEERGLLRTYTRPEAVWCQLTPEIILAASLDRGDWLAVRATQGPAITIKESAFYRALAERVGFERAELAVLVDDPEGKGKERLEHDAARFGVGVPSAMIEKMVRAGLSVDIGSEVALLAVGEAPTPEGAQSMREAAESALRSLTNNMFVGMFGLRPFLSAIQADNQENFVIVRANYVAAELYALIHKLSSVLGMAVAAGSAPGAP